MCVRWASSRLTALRAKLGYLHPHSCMRLQVCQALVAMQGAGACPPTASGRDPQTRPRQAALQGCRPWAASLPQPGRGLQPLLRLSPSARSRRRPGPPVSFVCSMCLAAYCSWAGALFLSPSSEAAAGAFARRAPLAAWTLPTLPCRPTVWEAAARTVSAHERQQQSRQGRLTEGALCSLAPSGKV